MLVVGLALAALSWPLQASADATVVSSSPLPGAGLSAAPTSVSLDFSESLDRSLSRATVIAPGGQRFPSGSVLDQEITIPVTGDAGGVYRVEWVAVCAVDGHVLHGSFAFGVGVDTAQAAQSERSTPSPADIATGALRWLEYLGLIGVVGIMVVRRLSAQTPQIRWARPSMRLALAAAFVGGVGVIGAEAYGAGGSISGAIGYLLAGPPGWVRIARVVAEGAALALCLRRLRPVAPLALFATASLAFAGQAAGVRPPAGAIFADVLHLLSAGVWAGGIMALATLRPPGGWNGAEARALATRFGRVAFIAFAITAFTGVLNATAELSGLADLWTTSYGLVLSAKSAGVLAMLVLSALAWRRGLVLARFEAGVAVAVLAATALLAAYPLPPARTVDAGASSGVAVAHHGAVRP